MLVQITQPFIPYSILSIICHIGSSSMIILRPNIRYVIILLFSPILLRFLHLQLVRFRTRFDAFSGVYRIPLHLIYTIYISSDIQYSSYSFVFPTAKIQLFFQISIVHFGPFYYDLVYSTDLQQITIRHPAFQLSRTQKLLEKEGFLHKNLQIRIFCCTLAPRDVICR